MGAPYIYIYIYIYIYDISRLRVNITENQFFFLLDMLSASLVCS